MQKRFRYYDKIILKGDDLTSIIDDKKIVNPSEDTKIAAHSTLEFANDIVEFFQYFKSSEIADIENYFNHPLQDEVSIYIAEGNWNGLVDCYNRTKYEFPFYKILDAIFLQGKNDCIDDLVSAYMAISNSECDVSGSCRIVSYDEAIKSGQWRDLDQRLANTDGGFKQSTLFFRSRVKHNEFISERSY